MIRSLFLFALLICLAMPTPAAAIWLFGGGKKEEKAGQAEKEQEPTIYIKPGENQSPAIMNLLLNKPKPQALSPIYDPKLFEKLTPEMLTVAYTPKTAEELGMIAVANKIWEIGAITDMRVASRQRIAEAKKKSDAAIQAMRLAGAREQAAKKAAMATGGKLVPVMAVPQAGKQVQQAEPVKKSKDAPVEAPEENREEDIQIYNNSTIKKPSKVFTDF